MTTSGSEHWLDRLAAPRTRRQSIKAALAGAALTLPLGLLRSAPAHAQGPNPCTKGCYFTADQRAHQAVNRCNFSFFAQLPIFLAAPGTIVPGIYQSLSCEDRALLHHKADLYDCLQPGCPGFDPKAAGGPCDTCNDNCCTCQASPNGYICCIFDCNDPTNKCCPGG